MDDELIARNVSDETRRLQGKHKLFSAAKAAKERKREREYETVSVISLCFGSF
jgi:hypothetical protein